MMTTTSKHIRITCLLVSTLTLAACSSDMSDLTEFVENARKTKPSQIDPAPVIKPHETFKYQASNLRDPFSVIQPDLPTVTATQVRRTGTGPKPVEGRPREELEAYPLDQLRMVGILEQSGTNWALIKTNNGTIHRVKVGNYIGLNHGKIIKVTENEVELIEIVPDGLGDWMERPASIAIAAK